MNKPINWESIITPLDARDVYVPPHYIQRWVEYEPIDTGVLFHCETGEGQLVDLQVDLIGSDVVRVRTNIEGIRQSASDMLVDQDWPAAPFELQTQDEQVILETERLRLTFAKYPWQIRMFDVQASDANDLPFFSQQIEDRAYGPGYEVAPIGFDQTEQGRWMARETVAVTPGEAFYGLGEKFTPLEKWGQEHVLWTIDSGNVSSYRSYKNVPFMMSTAGYGLFVHSSYPMIYRIGSESNISYSVHILDSQLDYFVIYGPAFKHILKRYTDLTGRAPVPPKWSFGFWISRAGYKSREQVETVVQEMRARDFPCDVLSLDPWWMGEAPWSTYRWDREAFPNPEEMIGELRQQGVRTCLWINSYVPVGTDVCDEGLERGCFVCDEQGNICPTLEAFAGDELAAVDFTNPQARDWYLSKLERLLDMGVATFKTDFGEQAPVEAVYHDGRSGLEMHNLYPLLYNQAVFELTERYFGRGLVWARSAYAGSQRYPVQWGGDSYCSLDQMAGQIQALLNYGLSGVPFCSHDIGGFDYPPRSFDHSQRVDDWFLADSFVDPITYVRWLQFGVFSSHARAHGKQPREPWMYGERAEKIARRYLKLRYRLLPYIYSQAVVSSQTGLPMARPLVLEYPSDPNTYPLDLQYLFGDSFLVAPVVRRDNRCRVYLPEGEWVDYWRKEVQPGRQWLDLQPPLESLPLWARAGAIIPMGPETAYVEEKPLDPLTLELYQPQNQGETVIYDEDKPDIPIRYARRGQQLRVEIGPAPGQVEVVLYGVSAKVAERDGQPLPLQKYPGGQGVRFEGRQPGTVTFSLVD